MKNKHHLWKDNNTLKVKELMERMINIKKKFGFETIIPCWRNSTSCFFSNQNCRDFHHSSNEWCNNDPLCECFRLENILLQENQLEELCYELFQLPELRYLNVAHNKMRYMVKSHQRYEDWRVLKPDSKIRNLNIYSLEVIQSLNCKVIHLLLNFNCTGNTQFDWPGFTRRILTKNIKSLLNKYNVPIYLILSKLNAT